MEKVSFIHIPREWNRETDCLAKWASEHDDDWKVEGWEQLSPDYCQDLHKIFAKDMDSYEASRSWVGLVVSPGALRLCFSLGLGLWFPHGVLRLWFSFVILDSILQ